MAFQWIDLDGLSNMRDLVGTPLPDGRVIAAHRLLRSDNLNFLTEADIAVLVDEVGLTDVCDLRTNFERARIGNSPLEEDPRVDVHPGSLYPEDDPSADIPPWKVFMDAIEPTSRTEAMARHYLNYLSWRPDAILAHLRTLAAAPGATVVHCAAGKDRTGTLVGLILAAVGAPRADIVADYAASGQRLAGVIAQLGAAADAGAATQGAYDNKDQTTPPQIMDRFLDLLDERFGGASGYLTAHGWTDADQRALLDHLAPVAG